jgi:very-short-patch-repair endonuclease
MRGSSVSTMFRQRPSTNARIQANARTLRRRSTPYEDRLWSLLRDRRLVDFKFRRQVPIGRFIADFACFDARLIVELDGSQHADSPRDFLRDAELTQRGFRILRIWNSDLFSNRNGVLEAILAAAEERTARG